jgi:hypothetical protein
MERGGISPIQKLVLPRDEGLLIARRSFWNFVGAGVTVTDDPANDEVEIDIPGGGGVHQIGGASHSADTWANLKAKISDIANVTAAELEFINGLTSAVQTQLNGKAATTRKLDDFGTPDDNTDLDVSIAQHGLCPKLPNDATKYLDGEGNYTVPAGGNTGEGHIALLGPAYSSVGAGTWALLASGNQVLDLINNDAADADGDNISWECYLAAGTYYILVLAVKGASFGVIDIDIDAAEVASHDLYDAGTLYNQRLTDAGNVVAADGLKTVKLRVDGKNGASSGYAAYISGIWLWRTA